MRRRGRRTRPTRIVLISIGAMLAMVGGVIVGVTASQLGQPVGLSAGDGEEQCDPTAQPEENGQAAQPVRLRSNTQRWGDRRWGGRHYGRQSPEPNEPDPGEPAPDPSESAPDPGEPAPEPSDSAPDPGEPAPDPSESAPDPGEPAPEPSDSAPPCPEPSESAPGDPGESAPPDDGEQEALPIGPFEDDFVDIRQVEPNVQAPRPRRGASRGTFTSNCGRNENLHQNNANLVIAPGQENGAHHLHDLVGNLEANGLSSDEDLAASGTTCTNGDQSTYDWPVLRVRGEGDDPNAAAVEDQNNIGETILPTRVRLQWRGNPTTRVVAQPRFMRMITGDAKSITNGLGNTRPSWTCTGFTDRITNQYPLCPEGSQLVSIKDFPSCWDGQNTDSANHRDHLQFPDPESGACPEGTQATPQLRMTLVYDVPSEPLAFALDGFHTEAHDPASDHAVSIQLMSERLMQRAVRCINSGRRC
jgi:hypothetical protein